MTPDREVKLSHMIDGRGGVSSLPGKESKQEAAWLGRCLETVQAGRCPHTVRHIKGDGDPEVTM